LFSACGLSIKSIFSQPFNQRLEAYTQKLTWANYSCSDPIAYIGAYQVLKILLTLHYIVKLLFEVSWGTKINRIIEEFV